jgi:hypothetical protein
VRRLVEAPHPFCDNVAVPTRAQVVEALRAVIDPELRRDIVELGMVRSIEIARRRPRRRRRRADDPGLSDPRAVRAFGARTSSPLSTGCARSWSASTF